MGGHGLVARAHEVAAPAGEGALAVGELLAARVVRRGVAAAGDAPLLAEGEGDVGRVALVGRVEVDVVGDEEGARADDRGPRPRRRARRAEVGLPRGVGELLRQALVLAAADVGEAPPLGPRGGRLVEVDGDVELAAHALAEPPGDRRRSPPW